MGRFHTSILAVSPVVSFPRFCLEAHEKPMEASALRKRDGSLSPEYLYKMISLTLRFTALVSRVMESVLEPT